MTSQNSSVLTRPAVGYAAMEKGGPVKLWSFKRRTLRSKDVAIKTLYAGICHSDLHATRDGWGQEFPLVPGHEIMGEVVEVGSEVTKFKVGDHVLIGTIVDSCRHCKPCQDKMEVYCQEYPTLTFDGLDRVDGTRTRGGYSDSYVCDEHFVYHLPKNLDASKAAPLLCAGITVYSPLKHWKIGEGKTIGVIGIGGLGHLGVKFARALGAYVVAFTTSKEKVESILKLGAHEVVVSTDEEAMKEQAYRFDFVLDTISKSYPMDAIISTLKIDGTICSLGIPDKFNFSPMLLAMARRSVASSGTGGTADTQEMLDFCDKHNILPDCEIITPDQINVAHKRMEKGDVRYRFVIDMRNGLTETI